MARPQIYKDSDRVSVSSAKAETKLQERGERRAIINTIIDNGGTMELAEIDAAMGFDVRPSVIALIKAGWLEVAP